MIIRDNIYGQFEVNEPVILELIKSPSVQRLKNINQYGIPDKYYHFKNYSRYEHSVGVMLLLRTLKASLEEQVAGLLHDLSVLTFSHIADWVFAKGKDGIEDYHDNLHEVFVKNTQIPEILKEYGYSIKRILNEDNFTLLENKIPDICADRIDYALREFKYWLNPKAVKESLAGLINYKKEIVFDNEKSAYSIAINFLKLQTQHWGGRQAVVRYFLFSKAIKTAVKSGELSEKDFYQDDKCVLNKLDNTKNMQIKNLLALLRKKKIAFKGNDHKEKIVKKFRHVDPKVLVNGKLQRLSAIMPKFKRELEKHKKINQKGIVI